MERSASMKPNQATALCLSNLNAVQLGAAQTTRRWRLVGYHSYGPWLVHSLLNATCAVDLTGAVFDAGLRSATRRNPNDLADRVGQVFVANTKCRYSGGRIGRALRHFAEMSYQEIGESVGIPEKTVKSRLFSARQRLGELLGPGEDKT